MTLHVMIDIETFGTHHDAAIVQIGAVGFDPTGAISRDGWPQFERNVNLQSCILAGMTTDQATVDWWHQQPHEAKSAISKHAGPLIEALRSLTMWWKSFSQPEAVWSHGATFDIVLLENAYRRFNLDPPWTYRQPRDTRTLFWIAESLGWVKPKRETAHTALADALAQAEDVAAAYRVILAVKSPGATMPDRRRLGPDCDRGGHYNRRTMAVERRAPF